MKKCFIMFVFFVMMLLIAVLTESEVMISENDVVEYIDTEPQLISDNLGSTNKLE